MEAVGGLIGLLILIGDIWAIINVVSSRAELLHKILWIVLIIVLPLIGLIIWFVAGPKSAKVGT